MPTNNDFRPPERHGGRDPSNCLPKQWARDWYNGLDPLNSGNYGTNSGADYNNYGRVFNATENALNAPYADLQLDELSAITSLPATACVALAVRALRSRAVLGA